MKVTAQRLPESQVVLEIEVDPERVQQSLDKAYRRLAPRTRVPGFRPGKAPRAMVERYLGQGALLREALDHLVPEVYQEAAKEQGIEPIDTPDFEITSIEPVAFKATVPVRPTVDLGDYHAIRIEREPVEVTDEQVQENLEELRKRYVHWEPVDRPVQAGDMLLADIVGTTEDGEEFVRQEEVEFKVEPDVPTIIPGLIEGILGMRAGETRDFDIDIPEDFHDKKLAGKKAHYRVTAHEVKEEKLPDLNDEFAQRVGEGFATLSLLRERVRSELQKQAAEAAHRRDQDRALDALVAQANVEFPPVLVDREVERLLREQTGPVTSAQDLERRLQRVGLSEEELRAQLRPEAEEKVRRSLVLTEFAERENIEVTPEDIEAEIDRMTEGTSEEQAQQIKMIFGTENGREVIRRSLYTRKALDRLLEIAAPEATSAGQAPRKSPRRAPRSVATEERADEAQTAAEIASES
jgi:trigger factor